MYMYIVYCTPESFLLFFVVPLPVDSYALLLLFTYKLNLISRACFLTFTTTVFSQKCVSISFLMNYKM